MTENDATFRVRFRGIRGSYAACGPQHARYGGRTTCVEVEVGGLRLILDAGLGIEPLGTELARAHRQTGAPIHLTLLQTHYHHDHVSGFLFFRPNYLASTRMRILGPNFGAGGVCGAYEALLAQPFSPVMLEDMTAQRECHDLTGGETILLDAEATTIHRAGSAEAAVPADPDRVTIRCVHNPNHPRSGVIHYRVEYGGKSFVFATDVESPPEGDPVLAPFAAKADLLAQDAMYTDEMYFGPGLKREGWGHSTWKHAIATARRAEAARLALIHHDPDHDDDALDRIAAEAAAVDPRAFMAREGQVIDLL